MSLITEALQLRKNQPRSRTRSGESFPPMRRTSPVGPLLAGMVILAALVVLGFWKGMWLLEQVESLAGIRVSPPPPLSAPSAKASEPSPQEKVVAAPTTKPGSGMSMEPAGEVKSTAEDSAGLHPTVAKPVDLPEDLKPMDVNLSLALIEDEKARQQLDEENQKKIEGFLRKMDVQGVCHQGADSTAMVDTVLIRPGDPVGDFGLSLKTIEPRRLVFADRQGREYSKSY